MANAINRGRPIGSDGLTVTERDVLARWDGGASKQAIVAATGMAPGDVDRVISNFVVGDEDRLHRGTLVASNAQFLAAIAASGGRFA